MAAAARRSAQAIVFLLALVGSSLLREWGATAITQAIIWLPTGIAIAGLWLLGLRSVWVVAAATAIQRLAMDYSPSVTATAVLGSSAEAVCGVLVLKQFGLRSDFARLRDALALFAAAAVAPLASMLFSWIARGPLGTWTDQPPYSGFDGWWRMNALGALTVVPVATTWLSSPLRPVRWRTAVEAAAMAAGVVAVLWAVMALLPPGPTAIVALYGVLPIPLVAAIRFGAKGATATAALGAMFVAVAASQGVGPFVTVPIEERYVAIQTFELLLLAVPLVVGALIAEREASVSRLVKSEAVREALLNTLPDATIRLRVDGTILDASAPPGERLLIPRGQLLGRHLAEFVPPHVAERLLAAIDTAQRGERPEPVEYPLETPGGQRIREARFLRLDAGEVLGVIRDVTERVHTGRLLAWEAGILGLVATGRPCPEVLLALVQGIEGFLAHGRCSILMLEGRRFHVACAPSLPADYNAAIEGIEIGPGRGSCGTAAHENRTVVVSDIATDPLWKDYRAVALPHGLRACWSVPVRSPTGTVLGTFAIYHGTPHAPLPEELELVERAAYLAGIAVDRDRRESLLASIHRNVTEGIYRIVPGHGLVYANEALARMFGYDSPEAMLRPDSPPGSGDAGHLADLARLANEPSFSGGTEVQFRRRDGSTFWGLVSLAVVAGPDGTVAAYDGAIADITHRKELEEQLRQALKMEAVGKLAGGVAHDFNNLLTVIQGYAENALTQLPATSEAHIDVDEIVGATRRAASLTRQLLAFSRQQVLSPQVLDLAQVVEQLGSMLQRVLGPDVKLVCQRGPGPANARIDRGQFEQVVLNLVLNSRDAMPAGGTLSIATAAVDVAAAGARAHVDLAPGPYVALSVRDTGTGMSPEVRLRAFDPFFTTKQLGKGTGLGLSTVYGIVKQSGGAVWIDSEQGQGTMVHVHLPRVAEAPADDPDPQIASGRARRATVLVAEDEPLVRNLVERALLRAGHHVLAADDGVAALQLARDHQGPIHLLVTDAVMPNLGGRDLARRLAEVRPEVPILFMSGHVADGTNLMADLAGRTAFLQKPFASAHLLEQVAALLSSAGDAAR